MYIGTGSFGHPSFVGPYQQQGMGLIGFATGHDPSTAITGYHTKRYHSTFTFYLNKKIDFMFQELVD